MPERQWRGVRENALLIRLHLLPLLHNVATVSNGRHVLTCNTQATLIANLYHTFWGINQAGFSGTVATKTAAAALSTIRARYLHLPTSESKPPQSTMRARHCTRVGKDSYRSASEFSVFPKVCVRRLINLSSFWGRQLILWDTTRAHSPITPRESGSLSTSSPPPRHPLPSDLTMPPLVCLLHRVSQIVTTENVKFYIRQIPGTIVVVTVRYGRFRPKFS